MKERERSELALGFVRNDGRITRPASCMQDEGIVQPVSKEMDQLSRRLHHHTPPGQPGGVFFCLFSTSVCVRTPGKPRGANPRNVDNANRADGNESRDAGKDTG